MSEEVRMIRSVLGPEVSESDIARALSLTENNPDRAINMILDAPGFLDPAMPVNQELAAVAGDDSAPVVAVPLSAVKMAAAEEDPVAGLPSKVKEEDPEGGAVAAARKAVKQGVACGETKPAATPTANRKSSSDVVIRSTKSTFNSSRSPSVFKKGEEPEMGSTKNAILVSDDEEYGINLTTTHFSPYLNPRPISCVKPEQVPDRRLQVVSGAVEVEDGDFPEEHDWFLVGRTNVRGLSTCRGKNKVALDEIVHFSFPSSNWEKFGRRRWVSSRAIVASSEIVRFSTKRCGEIGKLPTEWSRCLVPLVNSSKVKVRGRCIHAPENIGLMQEIVLYVSFYIHISVLTEGDKSSCTPAASSNLGSTTHPLPTLFKFIKLKPFKRAEFTPDELSSRKRSLNIRSDGMDDPSRVPVNVKRQKGCDMSTDQDKDEQAISESALNKIVGAANFDDLEEAVPPSTLQCHLHPYQKQALYWMSELEKGLDVEKASETLHPCWEAYHISDKRAPAVYVNIFSGEATIQFPSATQMTRGGILADAMGLGKTVMTIALILSKVGRDNNIMDSGYENARNRKRPSEDTSTIRGGTLVVCPMALLGQWKDELEAHSEPGTISIFVHYGGDRTKHPGTIAKHDVVLTTYGVLSSAYKHESKSIFHQIEWHRVVLDEAHTIKTSASLVAQSAFSLKSHCRWCLTGTPLQNSLEDLYSLLRFLRVEPWCNWEWWYKLVQNPYQLGDERGLKLIKGILRPLMLRRTKETSDKDGRPILVLPPIDTQMVECEQSEAEQLFYDILFRKSQVKFEQLVAEGKVLQNYASILELLLRLRQCCNHPYLVMSRADAQQSADLERVDSQQSVDLDKIAQDLASCAAATPAFVEEVVEGIRRGDVSECPICLESTSDDPVLTPCMHRMCRECLLSSWGTVSGGPCPICRRVLTQKDLRVLPGVGRLWTDAEGNWKESSKIAKLLDCLEMIRLSRCGEKSIIFSQWTSFLDLLQIPLQARGVGFVRYDGKLSQKQREAVLKEFSESRETTVMLMSLRAGGVGLNLTAASNVFMMDPWWNPAVEEQAIMRIHRIGQRRQVRVRRFIVKGTVEERLQLVQARKQRMIDGALTDEEVRTARIEELKMLFR